MDEIALRYLDQGTVRIELPNLGIQEAKYSFVRTPPGVEKTGPTIFLVMGFVNDLGSMGNFIAQAVLEGRDVCVVGFPDSSQGKITPEFVKAVKETDSYKPYSDFYKRAIDLFKDQLGEFELWGYSTGCPIGAEILTDPKYQQMIKSAVFMNSAGSTPVGELQFSLGVGIEFVRHLFKPGILPRYSYVNRRKPGEDNIEGQEQIKLKEESADILMKKIRRRADAWDRMRVAEGGKIMVVSGRADNITYSRRAHEVLKTRNDQVHTLLLPGGHMDLITESQVLLPKILEFQKKINE